MKERFGFVSNSSSSSFILGLNKNEEEIVIRVPITKLKDMFNSADETSIDGVLNTKDEVIDYIKDRIGISSDSDEDFFETLEDEGMMPEYNAMIEMIEAGKTIIAGDVSYHDIGKQTLLKHMGAKITN